MRNLPVFTEHLIQRTVMRVTRSEHLPNEWDPSLHFLIPVESRSEFDSIKRIAQGGITNIALALTSGDIELSSIGGSMPVVNLNRLSDIEPGDVVAVSPTDRTLHVLLRASDTHHALFLTNRCNNNCLMCSQPPTRHDDSWLVEETLCAIRHIKNAPARLGLTGGEPLLLGENLRKIFDTIGVFCPDTIVEVLTNGRLLSDPAVVAYLMDELQTSVSWFVPLYGHADFLHDFIVQTPGAFDETLSGLLALQSYGQPIQLRIVLIEPILTVLPQLCEFIGKNLPFVREVALMGCEPTGFALANQAQCEVDLAHWQPMLEQSIRVLNRHAIPAILMNIPLCTVSPALWPLATKSISDWKHTFAEECGPCSQKDNCCGLFAWYDQFQRPAPITLLAEETTS